LCSLRGLALMCDIMACVCVYIYVWYEHMYTHRHTPMHQMHHSSLSDNDASSHDASFISVSSPVFALPERDLLVSKETYQKETY
jgi:hypothetical protein